METLKNFWKKIKPIVSRKWFKITVAVVIFLLALGLTLYPLISSIYSQHHTSEIHTQYSEEIEQADTTELDEARAAAEAYNASLVPGVQEADAYSNEALTAAYADYSDLINLDGTGLMGYLVIPSISVELPIYHGTSDAILEAGVGHLLGSSLPVGGESTHSVLTGHSGMVANKMLSDLEDVEIGDVFYLEILGETLAYEVDQIVVVEPYDTSYLGITEGEDYCTIITCTPFGINTHRLLVRGTRIEYTEEVEEQIAQQATKDNSSEWMEHYILGILGGIGIVLVLVLVVYVVFQVKKFFRKGKYEKD